MRSEEEMRMANLRQVLKQLRGERNRTQKELSRFDDAIAAFEKLVGNNPGPGRPRKPRRRFSVATRRKMAEAREAERPQYSRRKQNTQGLLDVVSEGWDGRPE